LQEITGIVPSLRETIVGCPFAPRCSQAIARCTQEAPPLQEHASAHWAACWRAGDAQGAAA
jgi:peptide/nickel transport system ATP-binding protein